MIFMKTPKYKRILLKLSGEALAPADNSSILDFDFMSKVAKQVKRCVEMGVQVGIIVGAGNIWRGRQGTEMDRCRADHMGMLATAINSLGLQDVFIREGMDTVVMTAVEMKAYADAYNSRDAIRALESGKVVIFGCGLGTPFFSTDTAAVLRAAEIGADCILMAKNIDAIYSADPKKDPDAVRYSKLTYREALDKNLKATDITAMALAMDNNMTMVCFGLDEENSIVRVVRGEEIGTTVKNEF
jgi:uridylate kinase